VNTSVTLSVPAARPKKLDFMPTVWRRSGEI